MMPASKILVVVALSLVATSAVAAQCPDGTPPPCDGRRAVPLSAIPKRVNPPLNDKTWIVLPFNNVTHAPDTEWLSDASVNLLSMDLSRWEDVNVIDDRRVADFMREVPKSAKLSFNDGVTVAKRAGAGKLVIGDVLKVGSKTTVTATVYSSRDGKQIRSARQETTFADSLMPMFGKLASSLLALPATDANMGLVGTSRADAYQEYIAGMQALNKFDAPTAKKHFEAALKLDTTFALAHARWAIASTYDEQAKAARASQVKLTDVGNLLKLVEDTAQVRHAQAAARLSAGLPLREKKLIAGLVATAGHDYPRACESFGSLVHSDSSDVEALYGFGMCLFSDDLVEPVIPGDTSRLRFRTNWNAALHAFRRAIIIDPTFHLAFDPIVTILTAPARGGCARSEITTCSDSSNHSLYVAPVLRQGDTLVTIPRGGFKTTIEVIVEGSRASAPRANIEAARAAAADWAAAGPTEGRAHKNLARLLLRLGRPAEAEGQISEAVLDPALRGDHELWMQRLEVAVKLFRGKQVNQMLDSMTQVFPGELGLATYAALAPIAGRMQTLDSLYAARFKGTKAPSFVVTMVTQVGRITTGASGDTVAALERLLLADVDAHAPGTKCNRGCISILGPGLMLAMQTPRAAWPTFGPPADSEPRLAPALALAKKDTAQLRAAARMLDSASKKFALLGMQDDGSSAIAVDAYLILHDSVAALATVRRMMDTTLMTTGVDGLLGIGGAANAGLFPRALRLRADLEATVVTKDRTTGDKAMAKDLYAKFLELWANADPEFKPLLARVRASQAKLAKD